MNQAITEAMVEAAARALCRHGTSFPTNEQTISWVDEKWPRFKEEASLAISAALSAGQAQPREVERTPPELLGEAERKEILADAEALWKDLQKNNLGGFSGPNQPFYILHEFKRIIEKYGNRDVGLTWSKNELDALAKEEGR